MRQRKIIGIAAPIFFLVWAVLSLVFADIRCSTSDSAYLFFKNLNQYHFNWQDVQWSNLITHVCMKWGSSLEISMAAMAYIFSLSFVLYTYLVFAVCFYGFHSTKGGLAVMLMSVCGSLTFVSPASGAWNACLLLILFYASFDRLPWVKPDSKNGGKTVIRFLLRSLLLVYALFCDPSILGAIIVSVLWMIWDEKPGKINLLSYVLLSTAVYVWFVSILPDGSLWNIKDHGENELFFSNGFRFLFQNIATYICEFILLTYLLLSLCLQKRFVRACILSGFGILHFLLVAIQPNYGLAYSQQLLSFCCLIHLFFCENLVSDRHTAPEKARNLWIGILFGLGLVHLGLGACSAQPYMLRNRFFGSLYEKLNPQYHYFYGNTLSIPLGTINASLIPHIEFLNYSGVHYPVAKMILFPSSFVENKRTYSDILQGFPVTHRMMFRFPDLKSCYYPFLCHQATLVNLKSSFMDNIADTSFENSPF